MMRVDFCLGGLGGYEYNEEKMKGVWMVGFSIGIELLVVGV